jgi:predicted MFS family arabinose efflux permease
MGTNAPLRAPLAYPQFRRALLGRIVSALGTWMQTVAAGWLVYDITHSAAAVGFLALASRGPGVLLSGYGGVLADRFGPRRVGISLYLAEGLCSVGLAVAAWRHPGTAEVYIASGLAGIFGALGNVAVQSLVAGAAPIELRRQAVGLGSIAYNLSRLAGPAIGGGLVVWSGPAWCFALDAASFVVVAVALAGVGRDEPRRAGTGGLRQALAVARSQPGIWSLIVVAFVGALVFAPMAQLAPVIAKRHGEGAHFLGFLLAAQALGGLLGNPLIALLARWGIARRGSVALALGLCAPPLVLVGAEHSFVVLLLAAIVLGAFAEVMTVLALSGVQIDAPDGMRGEITGLFYSAIFAGMMVGAVGLGHLIDATSLAAGLAVAAGAAALGSVWLSSSRAGEG